MKTWMTIVIISVAGIGIISGLLYWGSTYLPIELVRIIGILLLWLLPASIGVSFYLGKVEARGMLHGADQILERVLGPTIQTMERGRRANSTTSSTIQVLPQYEQYPSELRDQSRQSSVFDYPQELPRLKG